MQTMSRDEEYEAQLELVEGVRHPTTTVYRVSSFQEHNGSGSRSPSVESSSTDSNGSSVAVVAEVSEPQQGVRHWTYEEQFRQLYNVSDENERKEFLDKLFDFMQKKGTPITRIPIMAKQPLDLYKLFGLVVGRGGLVEVIKKKAWRDIAKELNLPASITSAAFTMRSQYVKYLYPFECEFERLSDPQELQSAIDSNKRDRRHSENVSEYIPAQGLIREGEKSMESIIGQTAFTVTGGHSSLQLISSPTVAIPQGAMPPYSGSFILAPSGVVQTPRLSPHLLQMASSSPHLPIVVPTTQFQGVHPTLAPPTLTPTTTIIPLKQQDNHLSDHKLDDELIYRRKRDNSSVQEGDPPLQAKRMALNSTTSQDSSHNLDNSQTSFANISIKAGNDRDKKSIKVTMDLNGIVYQGLLQATDPSSNQSSPSR